MSGSPEELAELLSTTRVLLAQNTALRRDSAALLAQMDHLLAELQQVVAGHGGEVALSCLRLVPLGYATGDSRAELTDMVQRYDSGRVYNAVLRVSPGTKYPIDLVSTGGFSAAPAGMQRSGKN